ncbi:MAG: hypothetical protein ABIG63_01405 [Chloroflexota bacterium]
MSSLQYINSKLSDALYILTVDEGDARTRLARVLPKIKVLSTSSFPTELQKDFEWVKSKIEKGIGFRLPDSPPPYKLAGITNATASKVIKKLLEIQEVIEIQLES